MRRLVDSNTVQGEELPMRAPPGQLAITRDVGGLPEFRTGGGGKEPKEAKGGVVAGCGIRSSTLADRRTIFGGVGGGKGRGAAKDQERLHGPRGDGEVRAGRVQKSFAYQSRSVGLRYWRRPGSVSAELCDGERGGPFIVVHTIMMNAGTAGGETCKV